MFNPDAFVDMLNSVPLTITEWRRQRIIYDHPLECPGLDLGFAAFFLNRCNRSGIIKGGGPIGGISQAGKWKLGARFNRQDLVNRVRELADFGDRIVILNEDATRLLSRLSTLFCNDVCFVYADPPYYVKGRELYLNHYTEDDHEKLAAVIKSQSEVMWVLTYDDVPTVRKLYRGMRVFPYKLRYSTHRSSQWGREIMIVPPQLDFPEGLYAN
jgi:DNA adenine methylase